MTIEIVVPQVGEAVAEVTLLSWLKGEGDQVRKGEPLFEVDTDKAIVEVEAFADGMLAQILVAAGSAVMPQQVVGLLEPAGEVVASSKVPTRGGQARHPTQTASKDTVSPLAHRIAAELGVDLSEVEGTGPGGRVTTKDVRRTARQRSRRAAMPAGPRDVARVKASPKARRLARELGVDVAGLVGTGVDGMVTAQDVEAAARSIQSDKPPDLADRQPLSRLRRTIAARMQASKQTVPHFYLMADVDMTEVQGLQRYCQTKPDWERMPSYTDIIVRACALSLAAMPSVNVSYTEEGLVSRKTVDIGIAVDVDEGLIVPVLPLADRLSLRETSEQVQALIEGAHKGRLRDANLSQKSMVVSNLGMYGVDAFVAIIDIPDPMILAIGRVVDRVVPLDGEPAVRPMCTLTLSVDHRVLDGVLGSQFLMRVKEHLEHPYELLG